MIAPLPFILGGFRCIYADPPWWETGGGGRGANHHYQLLKTDEIAAIPVAAHASNDAHLWLWATNSHLDDGMLVLKAWGFRYITCITWPKKRIGLGRYARGQTEHCLLGVRGDYFQDGQITTLLDEWDHPQRKHSAKPPQMREWIERVTPGPRLELFAREAPPGWFVWGNQVPTEGACPG